MCKNITALRNFEVIKLKHCRVQNTCLFTCRSIVGLSVNRTGKQHRLNSDFSGVSFNPLTTLFMNAFSRFQAILRGFLPLRKKLQ